MLGWALTRIRNLSLVLHSDSQLRELKCGSREESCRVFVCGTESCMSCLATLGREVGIVMLAYTRE